MSYQPLHHKYRPQTFADLVGQSAIAQTLSNAINHQRIAPAYLFSGPRGTGKTSSARILAKSLNCQNREQPTANPCGVCDACRAINQSSALDVIEIDAASNTGVDHIRELIERSSFAPVQCRYKLYIIDECQMLSTQAFNALLKTLEEPPPRVIFVLATTDPQRVLPTILSRCQRFDFQRIPLSAMVSHLQTIAEQEAIDITPDALSAIAQVAHGGLRDAQSLLDQLSLLSGQITIDRVWDLVGKVPEQDLVSLLQAIQQQQSEQIIALTRQLMDRGREPIVVLENLAGIYRDFLIAKTAPHQSELVALTSDTWDQLCKMAKQWQVNEILAGQQHLQTNQAQLKQTTQPRLWLEVTLLGLLPSARSQAKSVEVENQISRLQPSPSFSPQPSPNNNEASVETTKVSPSSSLSSPSKSSPNPKDASKVPESSPAKSSSSQRDAPNVTEPSPVSPQQPEPTTAVTHQEPQASSGSEASANEAQIWQQMLEKLPLHAKALVNQHCSLLRIENNIAQVGVATEALMPLAKKQKHHLEKALTTVCQATINVNFQVSGKTTTQSPSQPSTITQADATTDATSSVTPSEPTESSITQSNTTTQLSPSETTESLPQPNNDGDATPVEQQEETVKETREETPSTDSPTESETVAQELTVEQAAQELADSFKGDVIDFQQ